MKNSFSLLILILLSTLSKAQTAVSVVEFVNFECPFSSDINEHYLDSIEKVVQSTGGSLQVAPFSDREVNTGLLDRIYWSLDTIGRKHADNVRSSMFKSKSQHIPLNSRSGVEVFLSEQVTEEALGLKGLNYDRLFALANSSIIIDRQRKALELLNNYSPQLLPFFVFVTKDGAVDFAQRKEKESMVALAGRIKNMVRQLSEGKEK
jgi:hypothetical protein